MKRAQLYWAKGRPTNPPPHGQGGGDGDNDRHGHGFQRQHFPPDARTDCWFCLASPSCERHLIVSVFEGLYVAMPKGPINDNHALIVPVSHVNTDGGEEDGKKGKAAGKVGALQDPSIADEVESIKSKLRRHAWDVLNKDLFVFERAIPTRGGYHAHVQCIPVDKGSGGDIRRIMLDMANRGEHRFELREIQNAELGLGTLLGMGGDAGEGEDGGYFYAEVPFGDGGNEVKRFLYRASAASSRPRVPLQFGREVVARAMGKPVLGQWKACVSDAAREEELAKEFRASFQKFI